MKLTIDGQSFAVNVGNDSVTVDGTSFAVRREASGTLHTVSVDGRPYKVDLIGDGGVIVDGRAYRVVVQGTNRAGSRGRPAPARGGARASSSAGGIAALMPGKIRSIRVKEGESVVAGTVLLILEAMKMENEVRAPLAGVVRSIRVVVGSNVDKGDTLVVVE